MSQDRPLRVAHLIYGLKLGGLEQLVVTLASRARTQGVNPLILSFGENGPVRAVAAHHGVPLEWLGDVPGLTLSTLKSMTDVLNDFDAHIVHAHDLGPWLNAALTRTLRSGTKVMATFHQLLPVHGAKRALATLAALSSRALVACGSEVEQDLRRWVPPGTNVVTIGNGVAVPNRLDAAARAQARTRMELPADAVAVGYLGRLHEEKGPDLVLEAFLKQFSARKDVHLVLIGTGPLEATLRDRAKGFPRVHILGEVTTGASELLQGLDLYVQGSRREGRSLSMLEAMAAGLPTVAHDLPAIAEIHSKETAILAPLGDAQAFGAAMQHLVDDGALRVQMGAAARERVRRYSVDEMVNAYVALYRDIVSRREARPTAEVLAGVQA